MFPRYLVPFLAVAAVSPQAHAADVAATADASDAAPLRGFEVGGGFGLGKSDDNTAADFFLDVGARLNDHVFVGAYWDSLLIMDTSCGDSSTTCEVSEHRYGIEAQVHLAPRAVIDPWIGYGIGRFSRKVDAKSLSMTWNEETNSYDRYVGGTKYLRSRDGWELAILKLGLDFVMFRGHSRFGVVAAVALGSGDDGLARTATTLGLHVALTF